MPLLVASIFGSFLIVIVSSEYSSQSQTHSMPCFIRLAGRLSRPIQLITTDWSLLSKILTQGLELRQRTLLPQSATPQFRSPILFSGATSTGFCLMASRGDQCTCYHHSPCSTRFFRNCVPFRRGMWYPWPPGGRDHHSCGPYTYSD